jgi:hypothetical protein
MRIKTGIILFILIFSSQVLASEKRYDVPHGNSPQLGPQNAPITIIEFLDFQ